MARSQLWNLKPKKNYSEQVDDLDTEVPNNRATHFIIFDKFPPKLFFTNAKDHSYTMYG